MSEQYISRKVSNYLGRHPWFRAALFIPRAVRRARMKSKAQSVDATLQRLQDRLVEDVVLKVDEFNGEFFTAPTSHLFARMVRYGHYEPDLAALFLSRVQNDRDVVDVGANIGFYSVAAAKKMTSGRVLAIEPTIGAFARLEKNVARNGVAGRVILFNGLASNSSGESELNSIEGMEEYSSIGAVKHPSVEGRQTVSQKVQAKTVDELIRLHSLKPALMKVDVEGAEALVFEGAQNTLATHRPVVLSELSNALLRPFGATGRDVVHMFEKQGYIVSDPADPRSEPGSKEFGDILCLPQ